MTLRERYAVQNAGGNHQAQTVKGILQEGQKSYLAVMDTKLGTNKAPDPKALKFSHIVPPAPKPQPVKIAAPRK